MYVPSSTAVIVHQLYGGWVSSDNAPSHLLPSTRPRDQPQNTFTPTDKTTLSPSTALQQKHRRAPKGWSPTKLAPGELCPHQRRRYCISADAEDSSTDDVAGGDRIRVPRVQMTVNEVIDREPVEQYKIQARRVPRVQVPRVDFQGCSKTRLNNRTTE